MLYPIPLSSGLQITLAVAINLLAVILLWGPFFLLRRKYRKQNSIPFRSRLVTFLVFSVLFSLFWWGYLAFDAYVWSISGKEWIHEFLNKWTHYIDYVSALAVPVYLYELSFSRNKSKDHMGKILLIFIGVLLSVGLHVWFLSMFAFKGLVAKLA